MPSLGPCGVGTFYWVGGFQAHVDNLFKWNSVILKLATGHFVEYVHIKKSSAAVAPGDRVTAGQPICLSGDVGFCPSPHLHIQVNPEAFVCCADSMGDISCAIVRVGVRGGSQRGQRGKRERRPTWTLELVLNTGLLTRAPALFFPFFFSFFPPSCSLVLLLTRALPGARTWSRRHP